MPVPTYHRADDTRRKSPGEIQAEKIIREAEQSKARIFAPPGNFSHFPRTDEHIDDDFLVVAAHVDEITRVKIIKGEYIDFVKLIARDKVTLEEDLLMEMVNKGGIPHWVPVSEREKSKISSVTCWDQAFRVFSNMYLRFHPH